MARDRRMAHQDPRVREKSLVMNDATTRLLERLQTGWMPVAGEIDRDVPQRKLALWDFVPGRNTSPTMRLLGYLVEEPAHVDMNWMTEQVLWIDPGLTWALCEDGFYWLLADVVERRHGVMSGDPVFFGTRVRPLTIAAELIGGSTIDEIRESYPSVTRTALHVAILRAFHMLESAAPRTGEWPLDPLAEALAIMDRAPEVPSEPGDEMPDPVGDRLREIAAADDEWILQRDPGESDDEYAERAIALGCDAEGRIRLRRWRLAGEE